jgi:uncharacterized protein YeeX (DUF496 family)
MNPKISFTDWHIQTDCKRVKNIIELYEFIAMQHEKYAITHIQEITGDEYKKLVENPIIKKKMNIGK